jgi:hypothetical protein
MHDDGLAAHTCLTPAGAHAHLPARTDYISRGPLLAAAGLTPQQVQQELATWQKLGQRLATQLGFDHDALDTVQK